MSRKPPRPAGYHWDQKEPVVRPDGLKPCRWCKGPVRPPRRGWCGDRECIRQWKMRTRPSVLRNVVFRRDLGVCAGCGMDTEAVRREFRDMLRARLGFDATGSCYARVSPEAVEICRRYDLPFKSVGRGFHLWEADHIVPIVEGGDWFDLGNLRTLCLRCHKRATAELAARRARAKRDAEAPKSPLFASLAEEP